MLTIDTIFWYALVLTGFVFLVSGIDDLFFDIVYWGYCCIQLLKGKERSVINYDQIATIPEKRIAMVVGCWHEADVIEHMVQYNLRNIDYVNFDIFIGVYSNDHATLKKAQKLDCQYNNVHCVINTKDGPTNKADNLNSIYASLSDFERKNNKQFDIVVMHDSEDVIHFLSFKVLNYLIPRAPMVQIPIFPLDIYLSNFIHWSYCDEFAEVHTKDLLVRAMVNGFVPSAGVGTGFDRAILEEIAKERQGLPFSIETFTEDYNVSLQLHRLRQKKKCKKKPVFLMTYVERIQACRPWYYFGLKKLKRKKTLIATRALFPTRYTTAVRQRSRWTLGIVFQEWKNSGWNGKLSTIYFIFHDRKGIFSHFCGGFSYVLFLYWLTIFIYSFFYPYTITLEYFLQKSPWFWSVIYIISLMMLNRIWQRSIAVFRIYGFLPALMAPFRIFVSNFINMHALCRALQQLIVARKKPKKAIWDKTKNHFPIRAQLISHRRQLGDVLLGMKLIRCEHLLSALEEQKITKKKLGRILIKKKLISEQDLQMALSKLCNIKSRIIKKRPVPHIPTCVG